MRIIIGDSLTELKNLESNSVNCCVTSPPYYGLRDYGTAKWQGGDPMCDHAFPDEAPNSVKMTDGQKTSHAGRFAHLPCRKCGAIRIDEQIGLEKTPDEYVQKLVEIFREVRRVLRDDGTLWLNLGDSYNSHSCGKGNVGGIEGGRKNKIDNTANTHRGKLNLKDKDLVGIPWMVAFALRADGWYLRQDIIWSKPNPMPESVTDRCTKSHEYIFLLSKSARYWYDADAIKEQQKESTSERYKYGWNGIDDDNSKGARTGSAFKKMKNGMKMGEAMGGNGKRNKRSVWTISTKPYKEAHFATFPPDLIRPCILAGCPVGGVVLDPFAGSGTTMAVAFGEGRDAIGIELNPQYEKLIKKRIQEKYNNISMFQNRTICNEQMEAALV